MICSLIETTNENSLDPYQYLLWVLRNAPGLSKTDEAWAEKLLPANAPEVLYASKIIDRHLDEQQLRWRPFYTRVGLTLTLHFPLDTGDSALFQAAYLRL